MLEAAGAVADNRVVKVGEKTFRVISSEGDREYRVYVDLERMEACSTDNGTVYRNYVGYPIISALYLTNAIPYDPAVGASLSGINWRHLNETLKSYALVEAKVKEITKERGVTPERIDEYVNEVYTTLRKLKFLKTEECLRNEL
ncbi:MAG: hypothetical protein QXS42_03870 [Zestosphaera sp.]